MVKDIGKWPSGTINSLKFGRYAVAERNPFQPRCKIDMVGVNSKVIWEMSDKVLPKKVLPQ